MDQEQTSAASEKGLLGVESVKHEGLALSGRLRWFRDIVTLLQSLCGVVFIL